MYFVAFDSGIFRNSPRKIEPKVIFLFLEQQIVKYILTLIFCF